MNSVTTDTAASGLRVNRLAVGTAGFVLGFTLVGCGAGTPDRPAAEVEDSAGIAIVSNRGADVLLDWGFEPVLVLGGADDGPEAFFQVGIGSIGTDAAGNLYVLDRGNHHVLVFDRDGRHLRTTGGRGGGPGELQWPASLVVWQDGSTAVADIGKRGLVRYTPDGEPLDEQRLEDWAGGGIAQVAGALVAQVQARDGETVYDRLVELGPGEPRELLSDERPPVRPVDFVCVRISGMTQLFAPSLVWAAGADFIAAATSAAYAVDIYEDGRRVASVRRDLPARPATRGLALQEVGEEMMVHGGAGTCAVPADKVVEERGVADVIPAVDRIAVAPDGTLWVRRRGVRGEEMPTDLFAAGGEYLGTLPPGTPFPVAFTPDGGIVAVERDDLDVPRIVVYRVIGAREALG